MSVGHKKLAVCMAVGAAVSSLLTPNLNALTAANTHESEYISTAKAQESLVIPRVLIRIAECESGNKHFDPNGNVVRGALNPRDVGRWQINLDAHAEAARKMGVNLFAEEGNAKYALYLYRTQGTKPWRTSKQFCWGKAEISKKNLEITRK